MWLISTDKLEGGEATRRVRYSVKSIMKIILSTFYNMHIFPATTIFFCPPQNYQERLFAPALFFPFSKNHLNTLTHT